MSLDEPVSMTSSVQLQLPISNDDDALANHPSRRLLQALLDEIDESRKYGQGKNNRKTQHHHSRKDARKQDREDKETHKAELFWAPSKANPAKRAAPVARAKSPHSTEVRNKAKISAPVSLEDLHTAESKGKRWLVEAALTVVPKNMSPQHCHGVWHETSWDEKHNLTAAWGLLAPYDPDLSADIIFMEPTYHRCLGMLMRLFRHCWSTWGILRLDTAVHSLRLAHANPKSEAKVEKV
ncbi:hypothetical protein FIBSPDRAFT_1042255 [Athelia psychrophila]|uniref:Uncharacterized protein n=1 Tax=Athelia psychrophila TaxID=1759441 RepID=A0A166MPW2_9AGAM|nr:hypothetical protein FIBSPDRAFT_1042255 [Fibularhizoctonia sp. CBS 109695]